MYFKMSTLALTTDSLTQQQETSSLLIVVGLRCVGHDIITVASLKLSMGCCGSKRSTLDDNDTDHAYTSRAQQSASSSHVYSIVHRPPSRPKTDKGYGQKQSMQAFVSQNYEGFGQSLSASSTSLPKEPRSHTPVSQNRQGLGHTPKETDDRYKSPAVESVASSSSLFPEESKINHASGFELKKYSFKELAEATEHFSNNNFLGEGAFGQVFKANLDGKEVAIKKLKMVMDTEVDHSDEQPKNLEKLLEELDVLRIVNHPNVVKMVGYCNEQKNKLLVLEYVANKSLRFHLNGKKPLVWSDRMKIAIGSAKGLQYLHKDCDIKIIHRDIKADNILLSNDFEPKVADFSLAKFLPNATNVSHITSILRGTNVYADPEHGENQKVSEKSDVYSFGVVLMELISGRKLIDKNINIIDWAKDQITETLGGGDYTVLVDSIRHCYDEEKIKRMIEALIDPKLENYEEEQVKKMIFCAIASIKNVSKVRPTMQKIIGVLEGTIKPSERILDWEYNKSAPNNNNGDLLQPVVQRLFMIPEDDDDNVEFQNFKPTIFTYEELEIATEHFSSNNFLGASRLGHVCKGQLSGVTVTIKKFMQADIFEDIKGISCSVHHENLVNLIGYCDKGGNKLLVYEFFPKESSLRSYLHENGRSSLDWQKRVQIALSIARGLEKLQYIPWNIYEDLNGDNIFLSNNFKPKFAEYKHAGFFSNSTIPLSSSSTNSEDIKADVYFFGVILLELITKKQHVDDRSSNGHNDIVNWVAPLFKKALDIGKYDDLIDSNLQNSYTKDQIVRMLYSAAACVYKPTEFRPQIGQIIQVLRGTMELENIWRLRDNKIFLRNKSSDIVHSN
ncbi:uncharacterized protein LOC110625881 [Manihot esculenta]|uniref:Uncharacterized protein n=1 Tax=Manihot esculenta TaxID=3983 RepID=A0ACB7GW28_MANES|nr:uncharacterized protein LOC110625881 [Manihot esculenta]KAG8644337.1 hypothetical protein MANES_11G120650v8 [Manihot esculenta]